uniref:Peptidase aspartic putative domain-containing protein n=1 Tax=Strigamia maritima TaxID=126957 RepID=T1IH65_STRMM
MRDSFKYNNSFVGSWDVSKVVDEGRADDSPTDSPDEGGSTNYTSESHLVESSLIVTMPLPPLSEEAAAQLEFNKHKQVKAEAQAEHHKKAANATWDVQRDQLEYYLNIVENVTIITDLEAASGALSDILKDLKAAWPKRNVALASDVYVQELAWLHKSDTRVNFGERRYKAMLKHFQQSQAMNASTSALSSLSSGIPASKVTAKLPKLEMPKFSGLVIDWQSFEDRFEAAVGKNPHLSSVDKFQYLLAACSGDAHKLIRAALLHAIKSLPVLNSIRPVAAVKTRFALLTTYATRLGLLRPGSDLAGEMMVPEVLDKLPAELVLKYNQDCRPHTPDFESMLNFVSRQLKAYELTEASTAKRTPVQVDQQKRKDPPKAGEKSDIKDLKDVSTTVMMTAEAIQFMSFMAIATSPESETPIRIRGIVDSASHRSFVTTELVQALKLKRKNSVQMQSSTFSQDSDPQNYDVFQFELQSCHGSSAKMFEFYSVESLPTVASCSDPEVIKLLKMQKVPLAEPIPTITSDVHLLIGQDQLWQVLRSGLRRLSDD